MEFKNKIYHQLLERGSNEILLVIVRSIIKIFFFPLFLSLLAYLLKFLLLFFLFTVKKWGGGGGAKAPPSPSLCAGPVVISIAEATISQPKIVLDVKMLIAEITKISQEIIKNLVAAKLHIAIVNALYV